VSNKTNVNHWDENRLVSLLKQGHEEAFRVLVRRFQKKLVGIAYGITLDREESLEIVQEVFLQVYRKIHSFRGEASLSTWLHRITVNLCLNWQRRWKRRLKWRHQPLEKDNGADYPELGSDEEGPHSLYREKEVGKIFKEKLSALPEEARTVFVLKEVEGLSYDEIAKALHIKRGTVSSRLFYARKRLKESLSRYLDEGNP
jgi:RNA polymerase sigma-70 factor (ECF subfamily)